MYYTLLLPDESTFDVGPVSFTPPEDTSVKVQGNFYIVKEIWYEMITSAGEQHRMKIWVELKKPGFVSIDIMSGERTET